MILVLLAEAATDIREAFHWYEARRAGLGRELVAEVDAASAARSKRRGAIGAGFDGRRNLGTSGDRGPERPPAASCFTRASKSKSSHFQATR